MRKLNGTCLCQKVSVSFETDKQQFDACHCGMCRKWAGAPLMCVEGGTNIKITGEEFVSKYNSSDWAERTFCKNCGTHLYYHLKGSNFYTWSLGLFENVDDFKFNVQIFVDKKPAYYDFANKTEMMTEAEVLAKFNG